MLNLVGTALGGLGLFLLAVSMITDGLKLAAGDALRDILARSTATRLRGVASGIAVTGLVQSSSAVTVATIGFVNAGLLNLGQALGIVYGANVGTTMTGWLVAAIGFKFEVATFALPMIGAGMVARLLGQTTRLGACGEALAGFGLFFIGVDVLRGAFEGLAATRDLGALAPHGVIGVLACVGFGFFMTLVTQSSSAAIAITLSAASGGMVALEAAAATVIGANLGTTSTAALAVIGATPNARRVAAAHVVFNAVTGLVALGLLPLMLGAVRLAGHALALTDAPAVTLALFHTVFNVLGVALMWPLTGRLAGFLRGRFRTTAETLGQPLHLDDNVLATPALALDALRLELGRMAAIGRRHALDALDLVGAPLAALDEQRQALAALGGALERFVARLERERLPEDPARRLPTALRVNAYIEEVAALAQQLAARRGDVERIRRGYVKAAIDEFLAATIALVRRADCGDSELDAAVLEAEYASLRTRWHDLKGVLLEAASEDVVPVTGLNAALDSLRMALRIAEQNVKVAQRLARYGSAPAAVAAMA
ncbi:MAG: Na/Pi cotransporter family protein, partial [Gammaproteobacteria bacterium]|nr:Na/Pi cotransporter family protein [Gammaproteobacteria bacterium]